MSAPADTGGPAFPVQDAASWQGHGMSLRDYFAARVMAYCRDIVVGLVDDGEVELPAGINAQDAAAQMAYDFADAMLKARGR